MNSSIMGRFKLAFVGEIKFNLISTGLGVLLALPFFVSLVVFVGRLLLAILGRQGGN